MTDPANIVQMSDVLLEYHSGGASFTLLDIPRFAIAGGRKVGLSGPSGSGKSTLLNLCAGLLQPTRGRIVVDGTEITSLPQQARDEFRTSRIGFVFQGFNLIPALTAIGNVDIAMRLAGNLTAAERRSRAEDLLMRVGLGERMRHMPSQLSFGQMQRVGIARAIANHPKLILADEPTASLEPALARSIAQLLIDVADEEGATLLVATHDPAILELMQDHIALGAINRASREAA